MINDSDLSQISKQIQRHTADIEAMRMRAGNQQIIAAQKYEEDGDQGAAYFEKEALRLTASVSTLEDELKQLEDAKQRIEASIAELEQQKEKLKIDYKEGLSRIESELARLRGSGMI